MKTCPFCEIREGAPATIVRDWDDALAIVPLNPVVPGHVIVFPRIHVEDFTHAPAITGQVMARAAELGREDYGDCNLITSRGAAATQSVFHLHVHLVPREPDDGLALPWCTAARRKEVTAVDEEIVTQLADVIAPRVANVMGWPEWMQIPAFGRHITPVVRRVVSELLASGLVVPAKDLLDLADKWERQPVVADGYAEDLRGIVQRPAGE